MWGVRTEAEPADGAERDLSDSRDQPRLLPVAAQGGSVRTLGTFERGFDGWQAEDEVRLDRVTQSGGASALRIDGCDALAPTVRTDQRLRDVALARHTSLTATVRAGPLQNTDAPVQFQFELVHRAGRRGSASAGGTRGRGGHQQRGATQGTRTSRRFRVPQGRSLRLFWDLAAVDDAVLDSAVALKIQCERADRPAESGPYGPGVGGVRGPIFVEDVVASDSPDAITAAMVQAHWQRLEAAHGEHAETVPKLKTGAAESGVFVFEDGTETTYDFEMHEDGAHLFTLADRRYRFEDGMAAVERR